MNAVQTSVISVTHFNCGNITNRLNEWDYSQKITKETKLFYSNLFCISWFPLLPSVKSKYQGLLV